MASAMMLIAGYLAARKTTDDLEAFRPGPPRLADLLVFVVSFLVVVVIDLALAPYFPADPMTFRCRPPSCIIIPMV